MAVMEEVTQHLKPLQASKTCSQTYKLLLTSLEDWPRGPECRTHHNYGKESGFLGFRCFSHPLALSSAIQIVKERSKDSR